MLYTLCNKHTPVCDIDIDASGYLERITRVHNPEYAPYGVRMSPKNKQGLHIREWWNNRLIPATRPGLQELLREIGMGNVSCLALQNLGLSLSDQYWLRPSHATDLTWDSVNFFHNTFSADMGEDLLGMRDAPFGLSPNASSNGELPKKWLIQQGQRLLIKGGSRPFLQEPANEFVASELLAALDIPHVAYAISQDGMHSLCPNFITENTEYVPAWHIIHAEKQSNNENTYQFFLRLLENLGVDAYEVKVRRMLQFDYLIANEDRHFNNFGLIRNVETLHFIDFAPIFDNGNSLWFKSTDGRIGEDVSSKPFASDAKKQLALTKEYILPDVGLDVSEIITNALTQVRNFPQERLDKIATAVQGRFSFLNEHLPKDGQK